jgi:hypothetical protein
MRENRGTSYYPRFFKKEGSAVIQTLILILTSAAAAADTPIAIENVNLITMVNEGVRLEILREGVVNSGQKSKTPPRRGRP